MIRTAACSLRTFNAHEGDGRDTRRPTLRCGEARGLVLRGTPQARRMVRHG